jgi:glycosyltransferase involved in cell wall biosynthesis
MTVAACFLVKDPPLDRLALLVEYLRSYVHEYVMVVDDRTQAATVDVLSAWRDVTLVPFHWVDDFSAARNAALPHVSSDWILHVDPDELPSPAMMEFIRAVDGERQEDVLWQERMYRAPQGFLFFTRNYFDGRQTEEWEEHWHCRLFRAATGRWYKSVHEQVELDGVPESVTRNTAVLPKAPKGAYLIHSRMNDAAIDRQYAEILGAVPV